MVRRAAELARRRGTVKGSSSRSRCISPACRCASRTTAACTGPNPAPENKSHSFIVYCDKPIEENTQAGIARCIEQYKPVHTTYRLRVKAAKKKVET
jgi:hypothetical protein